LETDALVLRPILDGDEVSQVSYRWAQDAVDQAHNAGFHIEDLGGRELSKTEVHQAIDRVNPGLLVHYDHGQEDGWIGNRTELIISLPDAWRLSGRLVYTMNCLSAKQLGVEAWRKNAKVYLGYDQEFAFTLYDELFFREAVSYGLFLYASGLRNWAEIKTRMYAKFNELIARAADPWTQMWLRHDRDALKVYNGESPQTTCTFRKLALKLFGERLGWKIPAPRLRRPQLRRTIFQ